MVIDEYYFKECGKDTAFFWNMQIKWFYLSQKHLFTPSAAVPAIAARVVA